MVQGKRYGNHFLEFMLKDDSGSVLVSAEDPDAEKISNEIRNGMRCYISGGRLLKKTPFAGFGSELECELRLDHLSFMTEIPAEYTRYYHIWYIPPELRLTFLQKFVDLKIETVDYVERQQIEYLLGLLENLERRQATKKSTKRETLPKNFFHSEIQAFR